ncbi:MAG: hypothetical protein IJJ35_02140 [Exiguobacterium sp.]|nr:hypothetical protein [Exiguobacterium sp.]MBR3217407.1 hypothetical protein [Exiguobacterium sp.]QUP86698.1 hypothetical protein KD909_12260 [Exiguobacterium sp. PFWT01]
MKRTHSGPSRKGKFAEVDVHVRVNEGWGSREQRLHCHGQLPWSAIYGTIL